MQTIYIVSVKTYYDSVDLAKYGYFTKLEDALNYVKEEFPKYIQDKKEPTEFVFYNMDNNFYETVSILPLEKI